VERPLQINWKDLNKRVEALVFNNACLTSNPQHVKSIWNGFNEPNPGTEVRNNISLGGVRFGAGSVTSHNRDADTALFINPNSGDMAARNYALKPTATVAINKGMSVAPLDDAIIGLPDIGAYEYGAPFWQGGATAYEVSRAAANRATPNRMVPERAAGRAAQPSPQATPQSTASASKAIKPGAGAGTKAGKVTRPKTRPGTKPQTWSLAEKVQCCHFEHSVGRPLEKYLMFFAGLKNL
jgi:hypothetical protein